MPYPFGIAAHCAAKMHWDFDAMQDVMDLKNQLHEGLISSHEFATRILELWDETFRDL